jgi:DNA-binding response OmpR family regulator
MANILIIDDESAIVRLILKNLNSRGHTVTMARDGASALHQVGKESFQLVIVDSDLPKIDGAEVCRRIKTTASTKHVPVIMMTSNYIDYFSLEGNSGPDAIIVRPFTRDVLGNAVERALGGMPDRSQRMSAAMPIIEVSSS